MPVQALKYEAVVSGIKDAQGAAAFKKCISAVAGVSEVSLDDKNEKMTVTIKAGFDLSEEALSEALKDKPFSISGLKRA